MLLTLWIDISKALPAVVIIPKFKDSIRYNQLQLQCLVVGKLVHS